jgi:hypothetical protein
MSKGRRYGAYSVACDVDVDVGEVIADLSDDEIRAECTLRGIATGGGATEACEAWRDFADELRHAMASGDRLHHEVLIVRMLVMAGVPRLKIKAPA